MRGNSIPGRGSSRRSRHTRRDRGSERIFLEAHLVMGQRSFAFVGRKCFFGRCMHLRAWPSVWLHSHPSMAGHCQGSRTCPQLHFRQDAIHITRPTSSAEHRLGSPAPAILTFQRLEEVRRPLGGIPSGAHALEKL